MNYFEAPKDLIANLTPQAVKVLEQIEEYRDWAWEARRDNAVERAIYAADCVVEAVTGSRPRTDSETLAILLHCRQENP